LLPAIARVRQAAARTQASNNLKQLGLAVHNYASANNSRLPLMAGGKPTASLMFQLLPFIEQDNLYRQGPVCNADPTAVAVPLFPDPRDASARPGTRFDGWLATNNYAGNWLLFNGRFNIGAIPDGTSNTILFTERYQVCNGQPMSWGYDQLYYWSPMFAYY